MTDNPRRVHIVLQGKGGVGKTYVASLLAQFYQEANRPVVCYDTDPVNSSFSAITAISARPVALFNDANELAIAEIDRIIAEFLTAPGDVIVDNGAASFVPMSQYLIENDVSAILAEHGMQMVLHVVITGGGMITDTLRGLLSVFDGYPPSVKVVIWHNEFFGPVVADGITLEQMPIYRDHRDRIIGVVRLERLNPAANGRNVLEMLDRKLTFAEAISHPDFTVVPKQRLTMVRRAIFEQVAAVV